MEQFRGNLLTRMLWCLLAFGLGCGDGEGDGNGADAPPTTQADMMVSEPECTRDDACDSSEYCSSTNECEIGCRRIQAIVKGLLVRMTESAFQKPSVLDGIARRTVLPRGRLRAWLPSVS